MTTQAQNLNEEMLKSLSASIDVAIQQLIAVDELKKSDVSLQDAKLRPESANGTLPGDNREESTLKPEDAKKAEAEAAAKGENPFADKKDDGDKKEDKKDDKKDEKKDGAKDKKDDGDDDDDMDDDKAEKLKAKIKKYEDDKAAKAASCAPAAMSKSEQPSVDAEELKKSIVATVSEAMTKAFGDRMAQLEGTIQKLVSAPQPRQSVSGLAPLAKSGEDVQPAGQPAPAAPSKADVLDKLFTMQKSGDNRVDSTVIARVDMNDFSVLQERGINLK